MIIHDGRVTLTDRVALSNGLYEVAESMILEAELWTESQYMPADLRRQARKLGEIARHVLTGTADFAKAEAFNEAGRLILGRAIAARRFFESLNTPPLEERSAP